MYSKIDKEYFKHFFKLYTGLFYVLDMNKKDSEFITILSAT